MPGIWRGGYNGPVVKEAAAGAMAITLVFCCHLASGIHPGDDSCRNLKPKPQPPPSAPPLDRAALSAPRKMLPAPGPTQPSAEEEVRNQIAETIEFNDGLRILGDVAVLQSDLMYMDNGEQHRYSVVKGSKVNGKALAIERFDEAGRLMFTTFHSAEKLEIEFPDKKAMTDALPKLKMAGCEHKVPFDWEYYPIVEVRTPPTPLGIVETMEKLESLAGPSGRVSLCAAPCFRTNPAAASPPGTR